MEVKQPIDEKASPFNMAMLHLMQTQKIMYSLSDCLCSGDLYGAREQLEELYTKLYIKLTEEEMADLENKFKGLENKFMLHRTAVNSYLSETQIKRKMRILNREILKLMHKYKLIFPDIQIKGLDQLYQRYGLEK